MSRLEESNLTETRQRLIHEMTLFHDEIFNSIPEPEKWSAAQVCLHLVLVEKVFAKVIVYGLKNDHKADRKDLSFILDRGRKVEAPEVVVPAADLLTVGQAIDMLHDSREGLWAILDAMPDHSILAEKSANHPVYGALPLDQWVELLYLHEQRHIEQLKEIKLRIGARK